MHRLCGPAEVGARLVSSEWQKLWVMGELVAVPGKGGGSWLLHRVGAGLTTSEGRWWADAWTRLVGDLEGMVSRYLRRDKTLLHSLPPFLPFFTYSSLALCLRPHVRHWGDGECGRAPPSEGLWSLTSWGRRVCKHWVGPGPRVSSSPCVPGDKD